MSKSLALDAPLLRPADSDGQLAGELRPIKTANQLVTCGEGTRLLLQATVEGSLHDQG